MALSATVPRRPPGDGVGRWLRRLRRILMIGAVAALVPAAVSYLSAMTGSSNTALGVRSVEWLRDNGGAGFVASVENWYYQLTAPAKGGAGLKAIPKNGSATAGVPVVRVHLPTYERPPTIASVIHPALPGEGVWRATRTGLGATPPILVTTLRDEADYPRVVAGLAWIDTKRTQVRLYAGRLEPNLPALATRAMDVPSSKRYRLLATFNSGFKMSDAGGSFGAPGYAIAGRTYAPLKRGLATLVGYKDGRVNVVSWSHGATAPSSVLYARQNLPLIVDHGRPNPQLNASAEWGATVSNAVLVWRSGIGVDRHGNVIYAAGDNQTVMSLASMLIRAGAVRAMELDINSYWVSFITYAGWGALAPANLLPDMVRPAGRYLTPDDRDFFAVYLDPAYLPHRHARG